MKKYLLVFVFLCVCLPALQAQVSPWISINPLPQGQPLNSLWNISPDTLIAVGSFGTIIRSSNTGTTWNVQQSVNADTDNFNGVHFPSKSIGYVVGDDGVVLKTTDGGFTWVDQGFPLANILLAVNFVSPTVGWVSGESGIIYQTTNGGGTWIPQNTNTTQSIFAIQFLSAQVGYAFGTKGTYLKTTNGGSTWSKTIIDSTRSIYSCSFISAQTGWAVGLSGYIVKTTNGGQSWIPEVSPLFTSLFTVHFIDSLHGIAGGSIGSILKTTNSGATWTSQLPDLNDDVYALRLTSSAVGWSVGDVGRILKSTDAGVTWKLKSTGTKADMFAAYFPSVNTGYTVGDTGVVVKTTDGGLSWASQISGSDLPMYGVYFSDNLNGWAAADSGVVLKTSDGGATWSMKTSPTTNTLYSVHFVNTTTGWAVGDGGVILKSATGGTSWTLQPTTPLSFATFTHVHFIDQNTGLVTASDGSIWKTTNGGTNWFPKSTGVEENLYSMAFLNNSTVLAVGDFGVIIKSTDAGETWSDLSLLTASSYYDVTFYNSQVGWAVGDDGEIISTPNGGNDWYEDVNPALTSFFSVQSIPSGNGALILASGVSDHIVSASINGSGKKIWTGAADTLWLNPLNWNPIGVPGRLDSVSISTATRQPVITTAVQQINIGTLSISSGAILKIGSGIAQLVANGSISVLGTLSTDPSAGTQIAVGGDLLYGTNTVKGADNTLFVCNGSGTLNGTFSNVLVAPNASMVSKGNITITNSLQVSSFLTLRQSDTLVIRNPSDQAFSGQGLVTPGVIKRIIAKNSTGDYRFESPATSIQFHGIGVNPDSIILATFSNSTPLGLPDSVFSPISYLLDIRGGSNPPASLCLRYDDSVFPDYDISLFRDSSGIIVNMGSDDFANGNYPGICLDTTLLYSRWYVGEGEYVPRYSYQYRNRLIISDNGTNRDTLIWGSQPGATTGLDASFGEVNLPAKPGSGVFDARWRLSPSVSTSINYLPMLQNNSGSNTFICEFQPGSAGYPMTIRWDSVEFPLGNLTLVDAATGGSKYKVYLKGQSSVVITDASVGSIQIIQQPPPLYKYYKGWNIASLGQIPTVDPTPKYVFPQAVSSVFDFKNGYFPVDTIVNGEGYWVKFADSLTIPVEGAPLNSLTIPLDSGWAIVGGISNPVAPTNVIQNPPGVLASPLSFFGYKAGYFQTDSVRPGNGYWIKAQKHGSITFGGSASKQSVPAQPFDWSKNFNAILISDGASGQQKLYFGRLDQTSGSSTSGAIDIEMPPPPPVGVFDASFSQRRMVQTIDYAQGKTADLPVFIRSQRYPVAISMQFKENQIHSVNVVNGLNNKTLGVLTPDQNKPLLIKDRTVSNIILRLSYSSMAIPKAFALLQNFPNPFNPTTTIRLELPIQSVVSLEIYNILGQRVKYLLNRQQLAAGVHDVTLDASSLASGVYFYRVRAEGGKDGANQFRDVKKLLLLK